MTETQYKKPLTKENIEKSIEKNRIIHLVAADLGWHESTVRKFMKIYGLSAFYRTGHATYHATKIIKDEEYKPKLEKTYFDNALGFVVKVFSDGYAKGYKPIKNIKQRD